MFGQEGLHFGVGERFDLLENCGVVGSGLVDLGEVDGFGQFGHREGAAVDDLQGEVDLEGLADARKQLDGQERVAAQVEEAVVDAHRGQGQQLRPNRRELSLELGARRRRGRGRGRFRAFARGHSFEDLADAGQLGGNALEIGGLARRVREGGQRRRSGRLAAFGAVLEHREVFRG